MSVLETLRSLRGNYGPSMNDDECVELINAAAWAHKDEGYGLSRKDAGTRGTRYDGVSLCHDVIMLQNGDAWDCLTAAGAQSDPTWGSVGKITDPSRGWVAPIAPKGGGGTVKPPVVVPPKPTLKSRDVFAQEFAKVNAFYGAPDGLRRPGGMVLHGEADLGGMVAWGYDLMAGKSVDQVLAEIKGSDEYRQKHPLG